jgi:epoxide hydrolase-like predicted phosphatase
MPEQAKAILFDIGNVLLRLKNEEFLKALQAACPGMEAEVLRIEIQDPQGFHYSYERGEISGPEFHEHLKKLYGLRWSHAEWLEHWNDYFLPNRPMEVLIAKLQGQLKFWALSNTNREHYLNFKREFRLFDGFEGVITSFECGLRKPDPRIYEIALKRMGLAAREVLFIDDLQVNVEVAKSLGFLSFHYHFNDMELKEYLRGLGFKLEDWGSRPSSSAC